MAGNEGTRHSLPLCYIRIDHKENNAWTFDKDSIQSKTRRTSKLLSKFIDDFLHMIQNIQNNKLHPDNPNELCNYLFSKRIVRALSFICEEMDERFYEHHGRVRAKHKLIEEQDDTIRILRRKIVHQRNKMSDEKKLIKDLKFADEMRSKIITANGVEKTWCFSEDRKKRVKDFEDKVLQQRKELKEMKAEFDGLEKDIVETCEKRLMKMNEMKKEIQKFVSFLSVVVHRNA